MSASIPIALVGMSGVMQDAHIPNLLEMNFSPQPPFTIAAICDRDPALAIGVSDALRVERMTFEAICADSRIPAVLIATPPNTHLALLEQALRAGKHVFMEKPLAFSISEAERMAELAREAKTVVRLGYMFRHHADAQQANRRLRDGAIGTPLTCINTVQSSLDPVWPRRFPTPEKEFRWGAPDPEDPDKLSFDMWSDNSVHYLNVMQWWFGPVEAVFAHWRAAGSMMMLRYKSGVHATHVFSPVKLVERRDFTVFGTEGMMEVTLHYPFQRNIMGRYMELSTNDRLQKEAARDHSDMYRNELVAFAEAIRKNDVAHQAEDFSMGAHDMKTVKAAHRSDKSGKEEAV